MFTFVTENLLSEWITMPPLGNCFVRVDGIVNDSGAIFIHFALLSVKS